MSSFLEAVDTALTPVEALRLKGGLGRWFSFQPMRDRFGGTAVGGTSLEFSFLRAVGKRRVLEVVKGLGGWLFLQAFFFHVFSIGIIPIYNNP